MRGTVAAIMILAAGSTAAAQDEFRDGRIRHVEPGVTLQRASEAGAEEATVNLPFFPGDRIWTDAGGRAEFQFADGSLLRVDAATKLDYVAHEEGRSERVVLRLWSGGIAIQTRNDRDFADFEVETPDALVETRERGVFRIDVEGGETRLSVYEGEATIESGGRRVSVAAGERSYARRGESPMAAERFDQGELDDFAVWVREREDAEAWAGDGRRYLPEEVAPYASELDANGSWYYEAEVGNVWRPYVASDWRPYFHGRWAWTPYGWTWVPNERWGWAVSHYGRWGHSASLGWYWIPGRVWGPAWVSWATGGDYVGWCPLGRFDRPVAFSRRHSGHAVPRGSVLAGAASWTYVPRRDLGARDLARRRTEVPPRVAGALRVIEPGRTRITRDGAVGDHAAPVVRTRPTPGDTVPELRTDPMTTIPFPVARRRPRQDDEERERENAERIRYRRGGAEPADARRAPAGEGTVEGAVERGRPAPEASAGPRRRPTAVRSPVREDATPAGRPAPAARPADAGDGRSQADREVLRRLFRPLNEPRARSHDGEATARPRERERREEPQNRGRAEGSAERDGGRSQHREQAPPPRVQAPPPPRPEPRSAPQPRAERAAPRPKEREKH